MTEYAVESKENTSTIASNYVCQQRKIGDASQFINNRQDAVAQRERQQAINNSPKLMPLNASQKMADNYTLGVAKRKENKTSLPDSPRSIIQRKAAMIQLSSYNKRTRPFRGRAAKSVVTSTREGLRTGENQKFERLKTVKILTAKKEENVKKALRLGAYRAEVIKAKEFYEKYPEGSYGHGRYLYLSKKLDVLGTTGKNNLLDFDNATVEVDHSPHDGSQRIGVRTADEASMYRVAVPLPRKWHRRHHTTHGPGISSYSPSFSSDQKALVKRGEYGTALRNHLMDTFSKEVMGAVGAKQIQVVAEHTLKAVNYAATNIPVKIHEKHKKGDAAISGIKRTEIINELKARIEEIKKKPHMGGIVNPFI